MFRCDAQSVTSVRSVTPVVFCKEVPTFNHAQSTLYVIESSTPAVEIDRSKCRLCFSVVGRQVDRVAASMVERGRELFFSDRH